MSDNGQLRVEPQAVIDALMARVQQLTTENVMLQAALAQLQSARNDEAAVPVHEEA